MLFIYVSVCPGVCFLFFSVVMLGTILTSGSSTAGFAPLQPFGGYPWQVFVYPGDGH